ncbi:NusA-like transcription termination signal-binding factor [Candidatus Woesearchaeota archaeon CG10_big_fil_rev_8_21_14_0_10_44_13]|nr:MAG: NusA-like transcription termination signal-binding factor [Candidatus Woesearchaeota archaeon CG10_big_fil_rev_8_21_14_0_10_44_13]
MKIKYDVSLMGFMSLFERITGAQIKDCYLDTVLNCITFVVQPGQLGRALGKKAVNVKILKEKMNKNIRVVEFNPNILDFIRNMVAPLKVERVDQNEDGTIMITGPDTQTKGLIIGRNAQNLRNLENNVRRYFDVKEIRVV